MLKSELRKIYLGKKKSLSPEERSEKNRQIADNFFQNFDLSRIRFLHCFLPIKKFNEIDTGIIFGRIWQDFPEIETLVPRVNFQTSEIENLKFTSETELVQNSWQIYEPAHNELVEAEEIDLVLVPLLCFDERGYRVGYGKGFYDRFLSRCRKDCSKIGLSYFPPAAEIEGVHEFDVKLDFCVTPEKVFEIRQSDGAEKL
ncbi:MAG TPA: 5-formyltetrahydrofolate cyclo-ligase [Pyrinomonadaceae bacterium]|nr:5-formyltetrahydrofolate cyclo-ligase [Pyrinomonadaceae bacterium]